MKELWHNLSIKTVDFSNRYDTNVYIFRKDINFWTPREIQVLMLLSSAVVKAEVLAYWGTAPGFAIFLTSEFSSLDGPDVGVPTNDVIN